MQTKRHALRAYLAAIVAIGLSVALSTCRPMPTEPVEANPVTTRGIYVLNEGLFQRNNSTLTFYSLDSNKATTDFFELVNRRTLGDTGTTFCWQAISSMCWSMSQAKLKSWKRALVEQ